MDPYDDLWRALGRFIYETTETEKTLYFKLILMSPLPTAEARKFYRDARFDKTKKALQQLKKLQGAPPHSDIDKAYNHIGSLVRFRNDLCHSGIALTDAHNVFEIRKDMFGGGASYRFTINDIRNAAAADMSKARGIITFDFLGMKSLDGSLEKHAVEIERAIKQISTLTPWSFHFPQPHRPKNRSNVRQCVADK